MDLGMILGVMRMFGQTGLGHGHTLPRQHALVHDGLALQQHCVTQQLAAVVRNQDHVTGHQLGGDHLVLTTVRSEPRDYLTADNGVSQVLLILAGLIQC